MENELRNYIKEEFGRYGVKLLGDYARTGAEIKRDKYDPINACLRNRDMLHLIEDETYYMSASFVIWSTEGDCDGNDAFLYSHIPNRYKEEIVRMETE